MQRTIRQGGRDYIDPASFVFSDAARRKIAHLRSAFPGKTVAFDWARSVQETAADGKTRSLGDMLIVGLGAPEESEPDFSIELDGAAVELAIPADVMTADPPTIDTDAQGKLLLR